MRRVILSTLSVAAATLAFSAQAAPTAPGNLSGTQMSVMKVAMDMPPKSEDEEVTFGEPGDQSKADRTITVTMKDMAYTPKHLTIKNGETVHFVVVNKDDIEHELTLGDKAMQAADRKEMAEQMNEGKDMSMEGEDNGVTVAPHKTGDLTWTFKGPETIEYDCNIPGHYESGMTGTITITK